MIRSQACPASLLCSQVSACPPVPGHVTPISSMNPWNRIQCLLRRLWERGLVHSSHPKINPLSVNRSSRAKRRNSLNSPSERKLQKIVYLPGSIPVLSSWGQRLRRKKVQLYLSLKWDFGPFLVSPTFLKSGT